MKRNDGTRHDPRRNGIIAPDSVRNKLARLVVRCADQSNARTRSGPRSNGWKRAATMLGINFQVLQRVVKGRPVRPATIDRVQLALSLAKDPT